MDADQAVYVIGHKQPDTDSVVSAIALAQLKNALGFPLVRPARAGELNRETAYVLDRFALPMPELLSSGAGLHLILVDHNEVAQAVERIQEATILEIWEHHRLGDLHLTRPIVFHCEPIGATATLIFEQFLRHHVAVSANLAGALLAAILSDTLVFVSPTCTSTDQEAARKLAEIDGLDIEKFGSELFAARGDIAAASAQELVAGDFKEFTFAGHKVGISQLEVPSAGPVLARREELLAELRRLQSERGLQQMLLLVTDIGKKGSHLWFVGEQREVLEKAFDQPYTPEGIFLDGCMSRKKQVVPALENAFAAHSIS